MPLLSGLPTQGGGRRLAEQRLVFDREAPELPEAKARRDIGHRGRIRRRLAQRPLRQAHAAQQQVALWPHSQMLLAAHPQRPARNPDRLAYLRDVERLLRVLLQDPAKAAHDDRMMPLRHTAPPILAVSKAADQGLDQRLLK